MYKVRLLFSKTDTAAYLSHLDLMKTLQRCFLRAGLPVRYSQGFNPHIYLSLPAPLSTGYQSEYELCDFELLCDALPPDLVPALNAVMPQGLRALQAGETVRPVRDIAWSRFALTFDCVNGSTADIMAYLTAGSVMVDKRSKRGVRTVDLCPYLADVSWESTEDGGAICRCLVQAGNDPLNPLYITKALQAAGFLPEQVLAQYMRTGILDAQKELFF